MLALLLLLMVTVLLERFTNVAHDMTVLLEITGAVLAVTCACREQNVCTGSLFKALSRNVVRARLL